MTEAVNKLYPNNPDKAARIIARKTEKIGANLSDEGVAWADYKNGQPQRLQNIRSSGKHAMQEQQQVAARILVFCNSGLTVHCLKRSGIPVPHG